RLPTSQSTAATTATAAYPAFDRDRRRRPSHRPSDRAAGIDDARQIAQPYRGDALRHPARSRRHQPPHPGSGRRALPRARLRHAVPDSHLRRRRGSRPPGRRDLQPCLQPTDGTRRQVRSEARDAYRACRSTYDIASHYQREILPLRKIITEEMQLRFSSMKVDIFALLAEARQRLASLRGAIDARQRFWLAQSEL